MLLRVAMAAATIAVVLAGSDAAPAETPSGQPITIGFSMPLTGGLAVNGTSGLLAMQIWAEDTNKNGGLLGRPVKLVYYDDQTNPATVPALYTKLLDVDKVDFIVSGYGTNLIAPSAGAPDAGNRRKRHGPPSQPPRPC